jgi:ring-1,2-phenylacetyl-CoA epoxidase subunit PaaE
LGSYKFLKSKSKELMAIQFHKLKVSNIVRETEDATSISFEIPSDLKETFQYKHGQYLTLRFFFDGEDQRRAYSICTSPVVDDHLAVTVKKVEGGKVSPYINSMLKTGDVVDVMPPLGNFTIDLDASNNKNYILFAGGSGITPIMSILKTILEVEKQSKVLLVYANSNEETIIFRDKLIDLESNFGDRLTVIHHLSKPVTNDLECREGRLSKSSCLNIVKLLDDELVHQSEYFMCGPGGMMNEIEAALDELNIDKKKQHKESFTVAENEGTEVVKKHDTQPSDEDVESVTVVLYGEEHEVPTNGDDTILVAGIKAGIDPPFSCQIGACSTCRARLKSGKVEMEADDALTEDEIEDGFVLTCTSHALTNDVVVDYDDNF